MCNIEVVHDMLLYVIQQSDYIEMDFGQKRLGISLYLLAIIVNVSLKCNSIIANKCVLLSLCQVNRCKHIAK